jgi:hypothetical protein
MARSASDLKHDIRFPSPTDLRAVDIQQYSRVDVHVLQIVVVPLRVNVNLKAVTVEDLVARRKVVQPVSLGQLKRNIAKNTMSG